MLRYIDHLSHPLQWWVRLLLIALIDPVVINGGQRHDAHWNSLLYRANSLPLLMGDLFLDQSEPRQSIRQVVLHTRSQEGILQTLFVLLWPENRERLEFAIKSDPNNKLLWWMHCNLIDQNHIRAKHIVVSKKDNVDRVWNVSIGRWVVWKRLTDNM